MNASSPARNDMQSRDDSWSSWDEAEQQECIENCQSIVNDENEQPRSATNNATNIELKISVCSEEKVQCSVFNVQESGSKRNAPLLLRDTQKNTSIKRFRSDESISGLDRSKFVQDVKTRSRPSNISPVKCSGVEGFPALNNSANHVVIKVSSSQFNEITKSMEIEGSNLENGISVTVQLKDLWHNSLFQVGSTIRLIEPLRMSSNAFEVSMKNGLVIVEPFTLLSSTTMTQALYCSRKAVLQDRFRGPGTSTPMLLGCVVHELFQFAIAKRPKVLNVKALLEEYRRNLMPEFCVDLVVLEMDPIKFEALLQPYLLSICSWIKQYFAPTAKKRVPLAKKLPTCFDSVHDIEDNIWTPTLGFKGKIDVSFRSNDSAFKKDVLALELKTGKSHVESIEHSTQVLIYSLMLSEKSNAGRILPGTVLYLKDNAVKQIAPKALQLKGMLQMRNRLVPSFSNLSLDSLPEPVTSSRQCSFCSHSLTCALADKTTNSSSRLFDYVLTSDMASFFNKNMSHLGKKDIYYARKWFGWIFADWKCAKDKSSDGLLFQEPALQRQLHGSCLANMNLTSCVEMDDRRAALLITFERKGRKPLFEEAMDKMPFDVGDMVVVSTNQVYAMVMGSVYSLNETSVVILINKIVFVKNAEYYHLDKYTSFSSYSLALTNIMVLMEDSEKAHNLRSLLIGRRSPRKRILSIEEARKTSHITNSLNDVNRIDVMNGLSACDYALITRNDNDETLAIIALVRCFMTLGKTVLLTASSATILDKLLLDLIQNVRNDKILRLGGSSRSGSVDSQLDKLSLTSKLAKLNNGSQMKLYNGICDLLFKTPLVASTCIAVSNHSLFLARHFDVCVVADASSVLEATIIRPILRADVFILFGESDCKVRVQDELSRSEGMAVSLMKRLNEEHNELIDLT